MIVTTKEIFDILLSSTTLKKLPPDAGPDTGLKDMGVDSLDVMQFVLALQEKYGVEIPDADIGALSSVANITEYLNRRTGK